MCAFPHLSYSYGLGVKGVSKMVLPADQLND